jgi:heme-binding protein
MHPTSLRRGLLAAFTATAAGGAAVAVLAVPSATAAPDPCAASQVAKTVAAVATNTSNYLTANPQADAALTTISQQQAGAQSLVALKSYFDANPKVAQDMQKLQQPIINLSGQCKLPISIPQVLGLVQAAQGGALPSLPGAQQPGAAPAAPVAGSPAAPAPVSAATAGADTLPASASTSYR